MLNKIENFANQIVDFLEYKNKKKPKIKSLEKEKKVYKEKINNVYYETITYIKNDFDKKTFSKLLKWFWYYSNRIDFYIIWNNSRAKLIVWFPENLEKKFIIEFYNYFPSSKIKKIDFNKKDYQEKKYIHTIWDDKISIKNDNFFEWIFLLFNDISSNKNWFIHYSLILNSSWDVEYETLFELFYRWLKLFFYWIYYFLYKVFIWKEPKKKIIPKKQELSTWIKWTALSIWTWWEDFYKKFINYFEKNNNSEIFTQDNEIFSKIDTSEFAQLFHLPTKKIKQLPYITYKRLAPPSELPEYNENTTIIWYANWQDETQVIPLKQEDKSRHVYIVWKTWVGKSTLLSNMIISDLENNRWCCLIDPHGDLVNTILATLPEKRKKDLVLFDVWDTKNPVWFNIFEKWENYNKDLAVSTTIWIFKKLYWNSWGPRLEYIFRNVLLALSDFPDATFLDILRMLNNKEFRKKVLTFVNDPIIKDFWEKEFAKRSERFSSEAIAPIMNKVWQFVSSPIIRNIFWQKKSTINIYDIMQENKILLVNLSKWLIWEDNSAMIGSFIVSSIQIETMKRANIDIDKRKDFSLYIDEFQNFATESFASILSEARKYKLSLIIANQYIKQIDQEVRNAIFGNVWNIIAFNSWNEDAEILAKQFKNQISVNDIISIPKFKAYCKLMINGESSDVFWISTYPIPKEKYLEKWKIDEIIKYSKEQYTKRLEEVEKEILEQNNPKLPENWINTEKKTTKLVKKQIDKKTSKNSENKTQQPINSDIDDIFEWKIKLKFNYGLFVEANWLEWLLHKKNIKLPEWISWKDYYNIWDNIRVKLVEIKEVDWQKKAIWENL